MFSSKRETRRKSHDECRKNDRRRFDAQQPMKQEVVDHHAEDSGEHDSSTEKSHFSIEIDGKAPAEQCEQTKEENRDQCQRSWPPERHNYREYSPESYDEQKTRQGAGLIGQIPNGWNPNRPERCPKNRLHCSLLSKERRTA